MPKGSRTLKGSKAEIRCWYAFTFFKFLVTSMNYKTCFLKELRTITSTALEYTARSYEREWRLLKNFHSLGYYCSYNLYSCLVSNFYRTEIEIWAGFGPVGNTEKNIGPIMNNFWGFFFMFSWAKKIYI